MHYSTYNLSALSAVAQYAMVYNIDMWRYATKDGSGMKVALDYLIPFYTGQKAFPHKQITKFKTDDYYLLMYRASLAYNDLAYSDLVQKYGKHDKLAKIMANLLFIQFPERKL